MIVKALSIRQPWAWLIVHGHKDIENRTWSTAHRGAFYVNASQALFGTVEDRTRIRKWVRWRFKIELPDDDDLPVGGIVGRVDLVDVVERSLSPWFEGPYGLVLHNAKPLPFRRHKGQLGFYNVN